MTDRQQTLISRATHYKPMLPSGVGSEPWLPLYKPWSFTDVTIHAIVPLGLDEFDVHYRRGDYYWRMAVRVAPAVHQLSLLETPVTRRPLCLPCTVLARGRATTLAVNGAQPSQSPT